VYELEGEGHVGPPPTIAEDDYIEQLMDVPETTSNPTVVAPYPTSTSQLRSAVVPSPKKMSWELRSLQSNQVAYIAPALPETKDQAYQRYFAMIHAAFSSVAGLRMVAIHQNPTKKCSSTRYNQDNGITEERF
jgi:hypothetical protein